MEKKAILVVSIGTSQIEALKNTTIRLTEEIQECFPEYAHYIAFSSPHILEKIKKQSGLEYFNVYEALERMAADGIEEVFVQPTYLLKGLESNRMEEQIQNYQRKFASVFQVREGVSYENEEYLYHVRKNGKVPCAQDEIFNFQTADLSKMHIMFTQQDISDFQRKADMKPLILRIHIGTPLLSTKEDHINTLRVILDEIKLKEDEALVLIGHGTTHSANNTYEDFEHTAYVQGYRNVFASTMEGGKSQRMTLQKLAVSGYKKVRLMPLLFAAGYHAKKDILAESGSWKQILEEAGYEVCPVMKGLGEYKGIRDIFIQHLEYLFVV